MLEGKRILIVEDSPVVAELTEQMVRELGCVAVGPAPNLAVARELAEREALDAAIVDLRVRGEKAYPVCEILDQRGVPFLLTSGYGDWDLPSQWTDRPSLAKPYDLKDVEVGLTQLFE
jgi:CheY-like chemotaxis protein